MGWISTILIASWRVVDQAIINASPLIFLSRSGYLNLLQEFAREIWVPEAVAMEILARGHDDVTARAIDTTRWLFIQPPVTIPQAIADWRLGAGESAVIALAVRHQREAIIDDLAGRRCAQSLNLPVRGTLGLVLVAKQRGAIPSARAAIEKMIASGLYLSPKVVNKALARVGE